MGDPTPREMIEALLDVYHDMLTPAKGGAGDGDLGVVLPGKDWRVCGQRLHDALLELRAEEPRLYAYVRSYYLCCVWTTKDVQVDRKTKKGRLRVTERRRVRHYHDPSTLVWTREGKPPEVTLGVDWLAGRLKGRIRLPKELQERLAA